MEIDVVWTEMGDDRLSGFRNFCIKSGTESIWTKESRNTGGIETIVSHIVLLIQDLQQLPVPRRRTWAPGAVDFERPQTETTRVYRDNTHKRFGPNHVYRSQNEVRVTSKPP